MLYYADNSWIKVYCTMDGQLLYIDDEEVDIATCTVSNCSAEEEIDKWGRSNVLKIDQKVRIVYPLFAHC